MTATARDPATPAAPGAAPPPPAESTAWHEERAAVRGARWVATAAVLVGVLNYGYALLLTRLLDVQAYATFAAGQGLVLAAATAAVVAVPWVLAQSLARARDDEERDEALRFAVLTSAVGGVVAAALVAAVATRFTGPATSLVLAVATLLIYVTRVTVGWLQGAERMRAVACLSTGEALLKAGVGLLLVTVLGLSDTGALAAFGIGVLPFVLWWPYRHARRAGARLRGRLRAGLRVSGALWRRAVGIATMQGLVAVLAAVDVVLVTMLPADPASAASYQAAVMVGRVPLFLAGAVSMAFFPALSRYRAAASGSGPDRSAGQALAGSAIRMFVVVAVPVTAVCATVPGQVLGVVFPPEYAQMGALLAFTALSGLAVGGVNLAVTFFQAANAHACIPRQVAGVAVHTGALLVGWQSGGIVGLAVGAAVGGALALAILLRLLVRRQGRGVLPHVPVLEPVLLTGVLVLCRPHVLVWLLVATAVGVRAGARFFRHRGGGRRPRERTRRPGVTRGPPVSVRDRGGGRPRVVLSVFDDVANPHYGGGGARVVERIARGLADEYEVTVVSAARHRAVVRRGPVEYRYLPVGRAGPRGGQLLFLAALPVVARRLPHDLWLENFTPPFSTSCLPLFTRAPVVGIDQGRAGRAMWRRYHLPFFLPERLGMRCYRHLVAMNEADADVLRRYSPHADVRAIPCGIEAGPAPGARPGRGDHILFLGRIDVRAKGLDLLLAAYERSGTTLPLVVAGGGTPAEERRLAELAAGPARGPGRVRTTGHVEGRAKRELLRRSAFVVLPSRTETFGLAALEGMSYGKPVLHFDLPQLAWMRGGGDVAVPAFDVDGLSRALRELADDPARRDVAGRQAHRASREYSWDAMSDRYLALARGLLDDRRPQTTHPPSPAPAAAPVPGEDRSR